MSTLTGSSSSQPEEHQGSSVPYRETCTPQISYARSPFLYLSEDRNSRLRKFIVDHWALESPRPDGQSTLTSLCPHQNFSYHGFAPRGIEHFVLSTPDTRCGETPMHVRVVTSTPVNSIGISDFTGSQILMSMDSGLSFSRSPILRHLSSTNSCCGPHNSSVGISRFAIPSGEISLFSKPPILRTPTSLDLLTHVLKNDRLWARQDIARSRYRNS
jgi:hypothetical protein